MGFNINLSNALGQYEGLVDYAIQEAADLGITEFKDFIMMDKCSFDLPACVRICECLTAPLAVVYPCFCEC